MLSSGFGLGEQRWTLSDELILVFINARENYVPLSVLCAVLVQQTVCLKTQSYIYSYKNINDVSSHFSRLTLLLLYRKI